MSSLYPFTILQDVLDDTIVREHPRASEPAEAPSVDRLTQLIAFIMAAPEKEWPDVAKSLSDSDATILVHAFERDLPNAHYEILATVIAMRPLPRQLAQAWLVLRNHPTQESLHLALYGIATALGAARFEKDPVLGRLYALWSAGDVPAALVKDVSRSGLALEDWFSDSWPRPMSVDPESPLAQVLRGLVLAFGDRDLLLRHQLIELAAWFDDLYPALTESAAVNYLNKLETSEWSWPLVETWVDKHGLPAAGGRFWRDVIEVKRDEIQRRIAGKLIKEFFSDADDPNSRFRFWENYVHAFIGVAYPPNRERVLMKFNGLIVVEFRDVGNAGYIYNDQDASQIEPVVTSHRPHADCKLPHLALHRIIHQSSWESKARVYLDRHLPRG